MAEHLVKFVEEFFIAVRDVHRLGAGTKERSYYPALAELLNAIGQELKPRVHCLSDLSNTGAGHPDFGLFAANQVQRGEPRRGQVPERGVIEMKSVADDAWLTADTKQVSKYFDAYRIVLISNLRDFLIIAYASARCRRLHSKSPLARYSAIRTREAFLERILEGVHRDPGVDAESVAKSVLALLADHIPATELEDVRAVTPKALRTVDCLIT